MTINTTPMFYKRVYTVNAGGAAVTACTTRGPTVTASLAAANILVLVPTTGNTDGRRIETIKLKGSATGFTGATVAQTVTIWFHDGTTARPVFELIVSAKTPSTTAASFELESTCDLRLASTDSLYYSTSITTVAATTAFSIYAVGGDY
jgi:hypothetical protein